MDTRSFEATYALCGQFATAYMLDCPDGDPVTVSYSEAERAWKAHHAPTDTTWDLEARDVPELRRAAALAIVHAGASEAGKRGAISPALYSPAGERVRDVRGLGWLLRHWQDVERFVVLDGFKGPLSTWPCVLVAVLRDGRFYASPFADASVMADWLQRSIFEGLSLHDWRGAHARHHVITLSKRPARTFCEALRSPHVTRIPF